MAGGIGALLYLMLDSGAVAPEPAPAVASLSLAVLALLFGVGAWAMRVGGQPERSPLLAGLALGVGGYALLRLVLR
ncbi:MAG TPA: hypothetical protein VKW76_13105 [Candidatus Binatia bacterium]|nr:hypothetical protein [Candidatus Binatia bacterium]